VVLWFSKKDVFFHVDGWQCLLSMAWIQGRTLNGKVVVFYGIEIFVSFSSIWNVCVVAKHMMIVWQGSCQVKCAWWTSRGGAAKG
jgi:hypothetical protein